MTQPAPIRTRRKFRPLLSLALALVLGLLAGALAFLSSPVTYQSTGTIHIRPAIVRLIFDTPATMPVYDSFVATQIGYIKSERCLNIALLSPQWLVTEDKDRSTVQLTEFQKNLTVQREGEFIQISFTDPNPKTAADAVFAVINAYGQLVVDLDPENANRIMQQLENLKAEYEAKLADANRMIANAASPYTPDSLRARYAYKQTESLQCESAARESRNALDNWRITHPEPASSATSPPELAALQARAQLDDMRLIDARKQTDELEALVKRIDQIQSNMSQTAGWLQLTRQKLEEARVNSGTSGRILIMSTGDTPVRHDRRLSLAACAASITALATFLLSLFFLRRRAV